MALPPVEWPSALCPLTQEVAITPDPEGHRFCRIDVDVDLGRVVSWRASPEAA